MLPIHDGKSYFPMRTSTINLAGMVMTSHPSPVEKAIGKFRRRLNADPVPYFYAQAKNRRESALKALEKYFGVAVGLAAQTHSTSLGLAQILGGISVRPGEHILTAETQHDATNQTLAFREERDGTQSRRVRLWANSRTFTTDEVVENLRAAITDATRILVLEWVSSLDGTKLPIAAISSLVATVNQRRLTRPLIFVVDGVHGFGIEDTTFPALECDFFIAGCHKSLYGPRGTAIICGREEAWPNVAPTVAMLSAAKDGPASRHVPGGVHTYEHWWALTAAFEFHRKTLGKAAVQAHVHELATRLKTALAGVPTLVVHTPDDTARSSGMVCFDAPPTTADAFKDALEKDGIIVSTTASDPQTGVSHVRLSLGVFNTDDEIDEAVKVIKALVAHPPTP